MVVILMDQELVEQVEYVLSKLRPYLQRDGGDVEFVDVNDEGVVTLRLLGACVGCGATDTTYKMGVEAILTDEIPFVTEVVLVED